MSSVITDYAQLIATVVLGIIAAVIAWQQYKTNHHKLRLDLFEKRMLVFGDLMEFIQTVCVKADAPNDVWVLIHRRTNERIFLFGKDISDYANKIKDQAARLRQIQKACNGKLANSEELEALNEEGSEILDWFDKQQSGGCAEVFMKYFRFSQRG